MLRKIILLFTLTLMTGISLSLYAQSIPRCATKATDLDLIQKRLIANKQSLLNKQSDRATSRSRETVYIPLKFHLVGLNNGNSRIESSKVFDQMCTINETFEELGVQFYIKDGFNYVDDGDIAKFGAISTSLGVQNKMQSLRDNTAVNIYVIREAQDPNRANIGFTLGLYAFDTDWIVVEDTQVKSGGMTLPHELGHFFSLPHPFRGWDSEPYDPEIHGSPAPISAPSKDIQGNAILTEFVDGSNCETAGDMICDTRADYLYFSKIDNFNCQYREPIIDPKGDTLDVDAELIMGYFLDRCMSKFTPMQVELIIEDYESDRRSYLRNNDVVSIGEIPNERPILSFPDDDSLVPTSGLVDLGWEAVEGATAYYVELYAGTSGTRIDYSTTATTNTISVPVEIGTTYRWRIKPVNGVNYCAPYSESQLFKTDMASSIPEVSNVDSWTVQPNPINNKSFVTISTLVNKPFEATIKITNFSGQAMYASSMTTFKLGLNTTRIPIKNLTSGIYIISIETDIGISHQKLIIQ